MFTLEIPLSSAAVDEIKAELTRTLPDVKSSHRCEAFARGLGFQTYASLLAATARGPVSAMINAAHFIGYLVGHGFEASPLPFYRATARVALRAVLEKVPKLTEFGIGIGSPRFNLDFSKEREALLGDDATEQFLQCVAFFSKLEKTKSIFRGMNSYGLKHAAERFACTYPEGAVLGPRYVSNGVLIAAAVHAGFDLKISKDNLGQDEPNAYFNISKRSIDAVAA